MKGEFTIPMSRAMSQITMHVRLSGVRTFKIRTRVAVWLMRAAALVIGCGFTVDIDKEPEA